MNNLPIQTYESVVQQRDVLAAENAAMKLIIQSVKAMAFSNRRNAHNCGPFQMTDLCGDLIAECSVVTPATDAFTRELMAKGVEALQIPESFKTIGENIRTQDNRATSHPLFAVMQKREIVVDGDYDHDRIVWWHSDGYEASETKRRRLELLHDDSRDTGEWRRLAVKEINEFVTACFTEQGCKDYLDANGHNLRYPFIYVFSAYRNAEFIAIREWMA